MSITEVIGYFYVVFATGIFTAALMITVTYVAIVGAKTCWRWIQAGQEIENHEQDYLRIVRTGK